MKTYLPIMILLLFLTPLGCEKQADMSRDDHGFSAPTKFTSDLNAAV